MQFILGSQSPRRAEILSFFTIPFHQMNSSFDEESIPFEGDPLAYALAISKGKNQTLVDKMGTSIPILTADTVVFFEGSSFAKAKDLNEAKTFLNRLQGNTHQVYTSVCLSHESKFFHLTEKTEVTFNFLNSNQIDAYLNAFDYRDRAGAYQIQGGGGLIVKEIKGCYYNVMGLPINAVRSVFNEIGINLWKHFKHESK